MKKIIIKRGKPKKEVNEVATDQTLITYEMPVYPENPKLEELKTARDTLIKYGINTDSTLENTIKELEK